MMMVAMSGVKRRSASEEAFRTLHGWIVSRQLVPGDKLPSQDELARQLAVSRNTIREAITRLQAMELVTARQGVGTIVSAPPPSHQMTLPADQFLMDPAGVSEFLEARLFIERANIRLLVMRADDEDIEHLRKLMEEQQAAVERGDIEGFSSMDVQFHMTLSSLSGNTVLNAFYQTIWDRLHKFIAEVSYLEGVVRKSVAAHNDIVDFIAARDTRGAEMCVSEHLFRVGQGIERNLGIKLGLESFVEFMRAPYVDKPEISERNE